MNSSDAMARRPFPKPRSKGRANCGRERRQRSWFSMGTVGRGHIPEGCREPGAHGPPVGDEQRCATVRSWQPNRAPSGGCSGPKARSAPYWADLRGGRRDHPVAGRADPARPLLRSHQLDRSSNNRGNIQDQLSILHFGTHAAGARSTTQPQRNSSCPTSRTRRKPTSSCS